MIKKVIFKKKDRDLVLTENSHLRLKEEANHKNENYFIFTDDPAPVKPKSLAVRFKELELRVLELENKGSK